MLLDCNGVFIFRGDGLTLQRQHADEGVGGGHSSVDRHQALKCNWEQYLTHHGHRALNIVCSAVASNFFCRQKLLRTEEILVSRLPHEASDCYSYRLHC